MSADDSGGNGLQLMLALGAFAVLVFLLGIAVIYVVSYGP